MIYTTSEILCDIKLTRHLDFIRVWLSKKDIIENHVEEVFLKNRLGSYITGDVRVARIHGIRKFCKLVLG